MAKLAEFMKAYAGRIAEHEQRVPPPKGFSPPVAISREIGSGGAIIAHLIAEKLGFQVCDKEILEEIARRSKVPKDLVELLDEKPGRSLEIFGTCLMRGASITKQDFDRCLKSTVSAFLELGGCVLLGRGAPFLAKPGKALRLRVMAPLETRVANVMKYFNLTEAQARKRIHETEVERLAFLKRVYGQGDGWTASFDLMLNLQCLTITDAVELALDAYQRICVQGAALR
jgi:cytidylate kinase